MEANLTERSRKLILEYRKRKWAGIGILALAAVLTIYLAMLILDDTVARLLGFPASLLLYLAVYGNFSVLAGISILVRQTGGALINRVYNDECDPFLYEACLVQLHPLLHPHRMACNLAAAQYQQGNYDRAWETVQQINPYKLNSQFLASYYSVLSSLYFKRGMGPQVENLERAFQSSLGKRKQARQQFAAFCARNNLCRAMENKDYSAAFSFLRQSEDLNPRAMSLRLSRVTSQMWEARICLATGETWSAKQHLQFVASQGGRTAMADEARYLLLKMQQSQE